MAGSRVIARVSRAGKLPERVAAEQSGSGGASSFVSTAAALVANQSCQTSVIRSTSGASVRTMRSSHHR